MVAGKALGSRCTRECVQGPEIDNIKISILLTLTLPSVMLTLTLLSVMLTLTLLKCDTAVKAD